MFVIVGIIIVLGSVFGGYSIHGNLSVLWQPIEFIIILGGGIGAFIIANPKAVITGAAVASFTVSGFGVEGLLEADMDSICARKNVIRTSMEKLKTI